MKVWAIPLAGRAGACFLWSAVAERSGDTALAGLTRYSSQSGVVAAAVQMETVAVQPM